MKPRKAENVDIDDFSAELELVLFELAEAKRQLKKAKKYASDDGTIPMYGKFSWDILVSRAKSLRKSFKMSWPLIVEQDGESNV